MHILNACNVHVVFYANAHETNTKDRCTQKDVDIEDYIWFTKSVLLIRLKERKEKDIETCTSLDKMIRATSEVTLLFITPDRFSYLLPHKPFVLSIDLFII
jgi:hypothetical protein